jgi:outer membrane protein assembly factor BamE (lipoprotein component of BamABCDE complex)
MKFLFFVVTMTLSIMLMNCSGIITQHGFHNMTAMREWIKSNTILKSELQARFGPPSFVDTQGDIMSAYYVAFTKERFAFFEPEITERNIIALHFKKDAYQNYAEYSLKDGQDIVITSEKTPTYGKDLSVIQQILSNVGRFNNGVGQNQRNNGSVLGPIPGGI